MPKAMQLLGLRFGRLRVVSGPVHKNKRVHWECQCDCGTRKAIASGHLTGGHTRSCGCAFVEGRVAANERRRIPNKHQPVPQEEVLRLRRDPANIAARFWSNVNKSGPTPPHVPHLGPCWLWTASFARAGYGNMSVMGRVHLAHRVAWLVQHGSFSELCVLHKCDTPACVRIDHLFEGSVQDNNRDKLAKGRHRSGCKPGQPAGISRLSGAQVVEIREKFASGGITRTELAKQYDVVRKTISAIVSGKNRAKAGGPIQQAVGS